MTTFIEDYIVKLTKDWLLTDSVQEMNRINNIIRALLIHKNSID